MERNSSTATRRSTPAAAEEVAETVLPLSSPTPPPLPPPGRDRSPIKCVVARAPPSPPPPPPPCPSSLLLPLLPPPPVLSCRCGHGCASRDPLDTFSTASTSHRSRDSTHPSHRWWLPTDCPDPDVATSTHRKCRNAEKNGNCSSNSDHGAVSAGPESLSPLPPSPPTVPPNKPASPPPVPPPSPVPPPPLVEGGALCFVSPPHPPPLPPPPISCSRQIRSPRSSSERSAARVDSVTL